MFYGIYFALFLCLIVKMKEKWRNIRERFVKCVNQDKSGDSSAKWEKYSHTDALSVLHPIMKKRETSGNIETDMDEED